MHNFVTLCVILTVVSTVHHPEKNESLQPMVEVRGRLAQSQNLPLGDFYTLGMDWFSALRFRPHRKRDVTTSATGLRARRPDYQSLRLLLHG